MAPRHEYDLRSSTLTHSYDVSDDIKPFRAMLECDQLIVPHEKGDVTLDKLKEFIFVDEGENDDPEYVEDSGESEDSLEYESENDTPNRDYYLRAPGVASSFEVVDNLEPVTVKFEWDQLIVPHKEGFVTLDMLKELVFEDEDDNEDPEYEPSLVDSVDSLEYESECEDEEFNSSVDTADDLASVVTGSCVDLLENEDLKWSLVNKAEEYFASFGVSQFGIKLVDSGLSVVVTPISSFSTWLSDGVRHTRRHLRAARRAGEKQNVDSCKAKSLLVHIAGLFPLNAVLSSMGVELVETYYIESNMADDDDDIDDPEYVLSSDESEDNFEFWSEIDSEEESDTESEDIETSDGEEEAEIIESLEDEAVSE